MDDTNDDGTVVTNRHWEQDGIEGIISHELTLSAQSVIDSTIIPRELRMFALPGTTITPKTDPCAGRKGTLNFSPTNDRWGLNNHIFPRHISTTQWLGKSKYVFFPWQITDNAYKNRVQSLDQITFENGKFAVDRNVVVYTYAFFGIEAGDDNYIANQVGIVGPDHPNAGAKTNVNTVVVSTIDCASVITSHPGLPKQFTQSDIPGAMFRTDGWSIMHRRPF